MDVPAVGLVRQFATHRLVPSRHLPGDQSVLAALTDDDARLQPLFELNAATNDCLLADHRNAERVARFRSLSEGLGR
jgi:hypothetical protein